MWSRRSRKEIRDEAEIYGGVRKQHADSVRWYSGRGRVYYATLPPPGTNVKSTLLPGLFTGV
jgi:hypothetical protein